MNLYVVPLKDDPKYTAALDFEHGCIYIGEGLLKDSKYFYQINSVIRHEIAHKLLMHQFRLMRKLGKTAFNELKSSAAFHGIFNTIADFEIDNRKYTDEDREIFRKLRVGNEYITCLVTQDIRKDWAKKTTTFEDMLDSVEAEIAELKKVLAGELSKEATEELMGKIDPANHMTATELQACGYYAKNKKSFIWLPLDHFFAKDKVGKDMAARYKDLINELYNKLKDESESKLRKILDDIGETKVTEPATVADKKLWWPEDKILAVAIINTILGNCVKKPVLHVKATEHSKEYVKSYNKIIDVCGKRKSASDDDIDDILRELGEE